MQTDCGTPDQTTLQGQLTAGAGGCTVGKNPEWETCFCWEDRGVLQTSHTPPFGVQLRSLRFISEKVFV